MTAKRPLERLSKPGTEITGIDKPALVGAFLGKYRNPNATNGMLTWNSWHLPNSQPSRLLGIEEMGKLDARLLATPKIAQFADLFIYFETPRELFEASPEQIRSYLAARPPWDDFDVYIFPSSMLWCVALTHDLPNGIGTIVAGEATEWDLQKEVDAKEK